jgi:hypothetical protein
MEQRLDVSYLRPGLVERAAAVGISAAGIGTGVLLAAWGISLLWRYTPPEIAVRIANPELRIIQNAPLTVTQDRPFILAQPEPLRIDRGDPTNKVEQLYPSATAGVGTDTKTTAGDVISREVTVFSNVKHGPGSVVTGWNYKDGSGRVPVGQYCYYTAANPDRSSTKVDIASNGIPMPNIGAALVPELDGAIAKCQWWQG